MRSRSTCIGVAGRQAPPLWRRCTALSARRILNHEGRERGMGTLESHYAAVIGAIQLRSVAKCYVPELS